MASCILLGGLYYQGQGVRQDYKKAAQLLQKACDGGIAASCGFLGSLYETGYGVRQNNITAKELYGKACDMGSQFGCDRYARLNQ